ncbi:MAG: hypothetical protein ACTHK4_11520 [Mycobacteriales bacterium]
MKRLIAVALLLTLSACSSASPTPRSTTARTLLGAQLETGANTDNVSNIVAVSSGYEAATWSRPKSVRRHDHAVPSETAEGTISFWRSPKSTVGWRRIGSSRYASIDDTCDPSVTAAAVTGAPDAVYVVYACLTGDGVINDLAYANGPQGWGVIEAVAVNRIASRGRAETWQPSSRGYLGFHPASAGRFLMGFDHRELETLDRSWYLADAGDGLFPRISRWRWDGAGFARDSDSAFRAVPQPAPDFAAAPMPTSTCPRNGTYRASFGLHYRPSRKPNRMLPLEVFPPASRFPQSVPCTQVVAAEMPMTVTLAHSARPYRVHARLTHRRWMSAPLWLLVVQDLGFTEGDRVPLYVGRNADRDSPYVVDQRYRVNVMVARIGDTVPGPKFEKHWDRKARPTAGVVTFRTGKLVGLAVQP